MAMARATGHRLDHECWSGGPQIMRHAGRKKTDHAKELTIVAVMRNANLEKKLRMHSHRMEPKSGADSLFTPHVFFARRNA